jgi:hypothetical protein
MKIEDAKKLFRDDKDAYGKPRSIMSKIDLVEKYYNQGGLIWN